MNQQRQTWLASTAWCLALAALWAVGAARAQQPSPPATPAPRIATVDMQRAWDSYYRTPIEDEKLRAQRDLYQQYILDEEAKLKKLEQEILALQNPDPVLYNEGALKEMAERASKLRVDLATLAVELDNYRNQKTAALVKEHDIVYAGILKEITAKLRTLAETRGYALALDRSGLSLALFPVVLRCRPEDDLTDALIEALNQGVGGPQVTASGTPAATPAPTPETVPAPVPAPPRPN